MNMCNNDESVYEYVFAMLAFVLQVPWVIPGILLVIQSEKGIGKSLLYRILGLILGEINCTCISEIEQLVGRFNDKRKDKKLVCLEEIGSSVYDPRNWNKIKDMITNVKGSFDSKHKAIEDTPSFPFFLQLTNDDFCVRVDPKGVRRVYLVKANNYWSYKQCNIHGRIEERKNYFSNLAQKVFSDVDGCLSAFAHFLYEYPLKKDGDRFVRLEHYNVPCKALHEQAMRSLSVPGQMVLSWIQGASVWDEPCHLDDGKVVYEYHYVQDYTKLWVPRQHLFQRYVKCCSEQRKKVLSPQNFWFELKRYLNVNSIGNKTIDGKEERGVYFPVKREMLQKFKEIYPGVEIGQY